MTEEQPKLRVLLDEGVPVEVATTFEKHGHEVLPFEDVLRRASKDDVVCRAAEANEAILVAFDKDMRASAQRFGISGGRFRHLSLVQFQCSEPMASKRLEEAMSLIEHEWKLSTTKRARRLHVSIATHVIRTHR